MPCSFAQKNKTLLVSLLNNTDNVSVKYLHAALEKAGHDSSILFIASSDESYFKIVAEFVKREAFGIVGISIMSPFLNKAIALTEAIRERDKDTVIVWGGVHPTIDPLGCRQYADYVFVGEAEKEFVDFVNQYPGYQPGFIECSRVLDLDGLAFPEHFPRGSYVTHNHDVIEMDEGLFKKYSRYGGTYLSVMSTRGCPFNCSYCCNNVLSRINGRAIRKRSPENMIDEILWGLRRSPVRLNYINFVDDCFISHSREWLGKFVKAYKRIGIPILFRVTPRLITEEKINILKDAPCGFALVGLQSGSERIMKDIYFREQSKEDLLKCSTILAKYKIPATYDMIIENPYETFADLGKTIDAVSALSKTSYVFFFSLTFYKHTLLYEKAKEDGFDVDSHITKLQGSYNRRSRESQLIRLALFLPKSFVLKLYNNNTRLGNAFLSILTVFAQMVLEPPRILYLAYLSQQKRPGKFLRLLHDFCKQFFLKIFFTKKTGEA